MRTALKNIFHRATRHSLSARTPPSARRRPSPNVESLEPRYALDAVPFAQIVSPTSNPLIGEEVNYTVRFDNTAVAPGDIGYSPFIDIVMPRTGDASTQVGQKTVNNGISFKPGTAKYGPLSLTTDVVDFDAHGDATHPFAKDAQGQPLVIKGTPGDQLVVVQLPFGSYGPDQPPIDINFTGVVSSDAQANPNPAYKIQTQGGFQYDTDLANNPTVNVATMGQQTTDAVEPQLFRLTKTSDAQENETVTGPNFTHTYSVNVDVATGQTVEDLVLTDILPNSVQFVADTTSGGTMVQTPNQSQPGGTLEYNFGSVTGTSSTADAVMSFTYFIPQQDAHAVDVIPLTTGGQQTIINTAEATGTWTSTNPDFPNPQQVKSDPSDQNSQHVLTAKTLGVQKNLKNLSRANGYRVGDVIEYTLNFELSDYFALGDALLTDTLSDGQAFDPSFLPQLQYTQHTQSLPSANFLLNTNYSVATDPTDPGEQVVTFELSQELDRRGLNSGTKLLGAGIPWNNLSGNGGTGDPATPPTANPSGPGTTGTVTFHATVLNDYRVSPQEGPAVVQGDRLTDIAKLRADVLNYDDLSPTSNKVEDGSQRGFTLTSGNTHKDVYQVNGNPYTGQRVIPGDNVTFKITYNVPFSSIDNYTIKDFLPLPIFVASNPFQYDSSIAGTTTAPQVNHWTFGTDDTFSLINGGPIPSVSPNTSVTANTQTNSLTWDFGSYSDVQNRDGKTEILFTVKVTDRPFGDGLKLTNQAQQSETNANGDPISSNPGITQVTVGEPELTITKGVVSTNNANGKFTPGTPTGLPEFPPNVSFVEPGKAGASFTGTITSGPPGGLHEKPIDATLSNVAGNDLVKFAIIVENTGSSPNGAFDVTISDTYDTTKFQIPTNSTGLNLQVTNGDGTTLTYAGTDTDLFGAGIKLDDPGPTSGSLKRGSQLDGSPINNGENIAVITYDLQISPTVAPLEIIPNTGTVKKYASIEGGPNFANGLKDDTDVTIQGPELAKSLLGTSIVDAYNSNTQAVIGEIATYKLDVAIPRGTTPDAIVVDSLPAGLAFKQLLGAPVVDSGISYTGSLNPVVSNNGRTVTFDLGDVTNTNASNDLKGFSVEYEAVVLNVSTNNAGTTLQNTASLDWSTPHTALPPVQATAITVIEPTITVNKKVSPSTAQAGDKATFTIDVSGGGTTAHEVDLQDIFPAHITPVANSLKHVSGVSPTTLISSTGGYGFEAKWNTLNPGQKSKLSFEVLVDANVISGTPITNTANVTWTSLGDPSQLIANNPNAYQRTGSGITSDNQLNDYATANSATLNVEKPKIAKTLVSTSIVNAHNSNTQAVIGETATYEIVVEIPQGLTPAAIFKDRFTKLQLAYVSSTTPVINDPANLTVPGLTDPPVISGNQKFATWNFGDIVNTDTDSTTPETITWQVTTLVLNDDDNVNGSDVQNDVRMQWASNSNTSWKKNTEVQVIEPKLTTTKNVLVGGLGGNPGDPVTYTIVIQQDATSPTDAFAATLTDVIPLEIASPVLKSVIDTDNQVTKGNFQLSGNALTTVIPFDVEKDPAGRTITLTIDGTLQGPFTANQVITNTNRIEWTSLGNPSQLLPNNVNAYQRTGKGPQGNGAVNYYHTNSHVDFTVNTADLRVEKTVNDATPNIDDTITFTVTVTNDGPDTATGIELTDTFPATGELQLLPSSISTTQGTYNPGTGVWNILSLNNGDSATLTLPAKVINPTRPLPPSAQTNRAKITAVSEPDPRPDNNEATATEKPKYADLEVHKETNNYQPNVNDDVTYTIKLTNNGPDTATDVVLTDAFPSPVTYKTATSTSGTTFIPTGNPVTGGEWIVPSIDPGQEKTLSIVVTADAPGIGLNVISITSSETWDPILGNNTSETLTNPQQADIAVDKVVDNNTPQVGDNVTFTIDVTNNGPSTALAVEVADQLPAELTFVDSSRNDSSLPNYYNPTTGVWTVGNMPNGASETLTITATVLAPSSPTGSDSIILNTATGSTTTTDPNHGNDSSTAFVTPLQSDLAVYKVVSDPEPNVGDTIEFAIGATNYGPADATGVVVTDTIPAGLTYVGPSQIINPNPSDGSIAENNGTITWTIGSLGAGSTTAQQIPIFVYEVTVDAPSPAGIPPTLQNDAHIIGHEYDPDHSNNTDSASETPQYADLAVDKQVSNATPNVGDVLTYTITVTNNGKDDAENVFLTDTIKDISELSIVGTPVTSAGTFDPTSGVWDIGRVYVGTPATLVVQAKVVAPATGAPQPIENTAAIGDTDPYKPKQYDPDPNNNIATATATPQYADLRVIKNVNNPAPNVGSNIVFGIVVDNLGANQASDVEIIDVLPPGLTFVSASSTDYNPGTGIWSVGTVDVGSANAKALQIEATVAASGIWTNEAEVSTTNPPNQFDPDLTNNKGSATIKTREADLLVNKTVNDATPNVGDIITFTIDVTNNGPDVANNVEITDQLPAAGLGFDKYTATQGSYDSGTGIWNVGTVGVGAVNKQTLTIDAKVLAPPRTAAFTIPPAQTNVAEVTKVDEHDPDPKNNVGKVTETPKYADLSVEKITTDEKPNVGDQFTYTVTLKNNGLDTATNVEVTEFFPSNISVLSVTPTNSFTQTRWNLNQAGDGGVWSVPTIAPGKSEVLYIIAEATSANVAFNVVAINHSDVWDPNLNNNQTQTPTDPQQADLVVTKTVDTPRPEVNADVTFTITLENLGPTDAQDVVVADPVPSGMTYTPGSYTATAGTYVAGDWTLGTVSAGITETLTITMSVDEPASGFGPVSVIPNTATATSTTVDPKTWNNSSTVTVDPLQADLEITKTASNPKPQIGSTFDYTIDVSNLGPDTATGVFVDDVLPAGVTYDSDTSGGAYDASTGVWTIGTMPALDHQTLTITVLVTMGNSGGTVTNIASVDSGTWDPDRTNNTTTNLVVVPPRGVIVGTDIGCVTGPFVRVIDPDTGANRITPYFAYEPNFRGGCRVYGADVTGDNEPDIITAPGPGRPGEIRVWEIINGKAVENTAYSFFPFGPSYTGGVEISEGSITAAGKIEIVAAQNLGGLVSVFEVTPGAASPVNTRPVRQLRPFGSSYLGGVTIETADIGTVSGSNVSSANPDGIKELFVGSGFGIQAQVRGYNGVTQSPTLFNSFNVMGSGYNRGVSVARLPSSTTNTADRILVSSGIDGNSQVETYNGRNSTREDAFAAYSNSRAQVFSAAIDDDSIFNVQSLLGTQNGVQKALSPSGTSKSTLPQSTASYPPLRVSILRN